MNNIIFRSSLIIYKKIKSKIYHRSSNIYYFIGFLFLLISILFKIFDWIANKSKWDVVTANIHLFIFGSFPLEELWRPLLWIIILLSLILLTVFDPPWENFRKNLIFAWIFTIPLGIYLLYGGIGLNTVMTRNWGGLILTILLTLCSLLFSLPIGIILALSRQCSLPLVKKLSGIYIDFMRAIPLIAVLFFGQLLIPLFLPLGLEIDRVWRAIFAFTLFVSAYIAEDIRGGLQSVPITQVETAESLGLNENQINFLILVPQALRIALPSLTNQTIGLFQNTSLMSILGLLELLGIGRSILANPKFIGQYMEVYIWLAIVYWFFCTLISFLAKNLEKKLRIDLL